MIKSADDEPDFSAERRYLESMQIEIRRQFSGQFVAIVGDAIVDHDADMGCLSQRTFAEFGGQAVFMPFISSDVPAVRVLGGPIRTEGL
jgi:hypothetical protein